MTINLLKDMELETPEGLDRKILASAAISHVRRLVDPYG